LKRQNRYMSLYFKDTTSTKIHKRIQIPFFIPRPTLVSSLAPLDKFLPLIVCFSVLNRWTHAQSQLK